jgi:hypothetical protein
MCVRPLALRIADGFRRALYDGYSLVKVTAPTLFICHCAKAALPQTKRVRHPEKIRHRTVRTVRQEPQGSVLHAANGVIDHQDDYCADYRYHNAV